MILRIQFQKNNLPHYGWQASEVRKRDDKPQLNHDAIKAELTPVKAATSKVHIF